MAKTKLTGFMKGAKQIVSFLKGELITEKQFNSIQDKMIKKYAGADKTSTKIFQDEERGIDQYGNRTRIVPDKPAIEDPEDELSDDEDSF